MESPLLSVALFPLPNTVLFPKVALPLQIFEPRYLQMMDDCLASGESVAILMTDQIEERGSTNDETYQRLVKDFVEKRVVCGIGQVEILTEVPPQLKSILLRGWAKVELVSILSREPYVRCQARIIEEQLEVIESNQIQLESLRGFLADWLSESIENPAEVTGIMDHLKTPQELVHFIAVTLIDEPHVRQFLLEINDINEKIDTILSLLGSASFNN